MIGRRGHNERDCDRHKHYCGEVNQLLALRQRPETLFKNGNQMEAEQGLDAGKHHACLFDCLLGNFFGLLVYLFVSMPMTLIIHELLFRRWLRSAKCVSSKIDACETLGGRWIAVFFDEQCRGDAS